ncbi:CDP-diacylglycerol-glycerol-3-phosphate 3-phosphatidyltransferase [Helcococcus kunzii ATCC 51366]|uniref:CDP-diacylglycerol--glycerol-3-phosphate 3-phosphatidyltransferase n=2 Tax=Helcococcus kunzii TaxID=40091 RepID=H3NN44_9FIRM|nr:CDP-diacylglycerol-glycerol-3-phosphate 3-phosphatidyltransferase [Helcococcus kunzii ATCC 51366]
MKRMLKMNLANKLTIIRLFMVPIFVLIYNRFGVTSPIPAIIFALTSATDFLDGYIARSRNLITTFGKFMDPLVDKVLTQAGYIVLVGSGIIPAWTVIVIVFRELLIDGLRILAASNNITIAASIYGKLKTTSQMITIIMYLLSGVLTFIPDIVYQILLYISIILTIISGLDYLIKNIEVLDLDNI